MSMVLPVGPTIPDQPDATAEQWERAAPDYDGPNMNIGGGSVVMYRTGPGDVARPRDEWLGIDLRDVPHDDVMNGRSLFVEIPGPPPEGHGGYDFDTPVSVINQAGQRSALFWSDWYASTAANAGGGGSFRGDHVIIARVPPGSTQGYMPTQMEQLNTDRQTPGPWDTQLTLGGAAVSM